MRNKISLLAAFILLVVLPPTTAAKEEFPGRKLYPDVKTISIEELNNRLGSVVVVDVRTRYEYDTIHVSGSENILVSKTAFGDEIQALRKRTDKPIVFYCNGHTCMKSYKAARRAADAGVKNIYAFDAGIFDWTRAHPDKAILLGQSPVRISDLISKDEFRKRLLDPEDFQKRVADPNVLVLDVRSRLQRAGAGLFPFEEKFASLDDKDKLDLHITRARREGKTILAYDAVGKQVRWFEYYLRKQGVKNYYFMKGGADSYVALLAKQQNSSVVPKTAEPASRK